VELSKDSLKELLKEILQESGVIPSETEAVEPKTPKKTRISKPKGQARTKKVLKVYAPKSGDIPKEEQRISELTKSSRSERSVRPQNKIVTKKCTVCGSSEKVASGSVLNSQRFVCNKCLVG
jgi:hypothetical protein